MAGALASALQAAISAVYSAVAGPKGRRRSSGGSLPASSTAWNPSDAGADFTFSNSNRSWQRGNGAGFQGLRGVSSKSTGKWAFRVKIDGVLGTLGVAVGKSTAALAAAPGSDADSWAYQNNGNVQNNGSTSTTFATYTSGDVITLALDADAGKLWWAKNDVWQEGDPTTATGGRSIGAGTWFPMANCGANPANAQTLYGASVTGFTDWT